MIFDLCFGGEIIVWIKPTSGAIVSCLIALPVYCLLSGFQQLFQVKLRYIVNFFAEITTFLKLK